LGQKGPNVQTLFEGEGPSKSNIKVHGLTGPQCTRNKRKENPLFPTGLKKNLLTRKLVNKKVSKEQKPGFNDNWGHKKANKLAVPDSFEPRGNRYRGQG